MNLKYTILFDYYGELLTEKEQLYFEDFYCNDLSYQEIAEQHTISRSAVYNILTRAENKLDNYENKLKLYNKSKKIEHLIKDLDQETQNKIKELI